MKRILGGALVGAIVVFAWQSFVYVGSGLVESSSHAFTNEQAVLDAVLENAPASGVYVLPNGFPREGESDEAYTTRATAAHAQWAGGPALFVSVAREGMGGMGRNLPLQFLTLVLASALATWFLSLAPLPSLWQRVLLVEGLALFALLLGALPNYLWWGFGDAFTWVALVEILVGWGLAGLVLGRWFTPTVRP